MGVEGDELRVGSLLAVIEEALNGGPAQARPADRAHLEGLYRRMALIRAFELRCMALFGEKLIRGLGASVRRQEAIAVGVCDALTRRRPHHQHAPRARALHRQGPGRRS